jgi:hypothetical protein
MGEVLIDKELVNIPKGKIRTLVGAHIKDIHSGARDFRL